MCPDLGLNLPNYYPDSRYDTSNTDISLVDGLFTNDIVYKTNSSDCLSYNEKRSNEAYSYDENIVLSTNSPLYDELRDNNHISSKPKTIRTIRGNTPYYRGADNYFSGKPQSLPTFTDTYLSDFHFSDSKLEKEREIYNEHIYDKIGNSIDCYETESNFDEINLNNEKIISNKAVQDSKEADDSKYNTHSDYVQENPLYDETPLTANPSVIALTIADNVKNKTSNNEFNHDLVKSKSESQLTTANSRQINAIKSPPSATTSREDLQENIIYSSSDKTIKTCVLVKASEEPPVSLDYKTVVQVEPVEAPVEEIANTGSDTSEKDSKHSHNYLKEFLESQKGSKRPLQNFISKKISRAFGDKEALPRKSSKRSVSVPDLSDNHYYSLPDVSIGKNLRKCEKIDRKLRKCENISKPKPPESRFIVNIGRHFDVTANTTAPVDFEVKISKVPKAQKNKKTNNNQDSTANEKHFLDAVKQLKETLNGAKLDKNHNIAIAPTKHSEHLTNLKKIANKSVQSGEGKLKAALRRSNSAIEKVRRNNITVKVNPTISQENMEIGKKKSDQCNKEFQEKLGNMRNYWDKMVGIDTENGETTEVNKDTEGNYNYKIIDVPGKVEDTIRKFEPKEEKEHEKPVSIVQLTKQVFEPKVFQKTEKISPLVKEAREIFENPYFERHESNNNQFESLNPNIVEIIENDNEETNKNKVDRSVSPINRSQSNSPENRMTNGNKQHKSLVKTKSIASEPEFDHVRYRVMKSDLFQKKIFANCQKESQFDGLMQYLQDYSFQELLIDNNIVIIEPIRSKIPHEASSIAKAAQNVTPLIHKSSDTISSNQNSSLRRHFFYHPIRVNKEVNDDELPNPDTVKQVRQFFETHHTLGTRRLEESTKESNDCQNGDPDKDRCSAIDSNSNASNTSDFGSQEELYDSLTSERCCEQQYVSEDILEKIRERGTSITYYGGRVLNKRNGQPSLTKAIMDEIKGIEQRNSECKCGRKGSIENGKIIPNGAIKHEASNNKEGYQGRKFRLLKSNSCSSRLELVGTDNLTDYKQKFLEKQKQLVTQHNLRNKMKDEQAKIHKHPNTIVEITSWKNPDNNQLLENNTTEIKALNKHNKQLDNERKQPKIIGEEMKTPEKRMMQWNGKQDDKSVPAITFNSKPKLTNKSNYNYHNYDKINTKPKHAEEMEFEPYEIAGN